MDRAWYCMPLQARTRPVKRLVRYRIVSSGPTEIHASCAATRVRHGVAADDARV
jgi:hypothetical protein